MNSKKAEILRAIRAANSVAAEPDWDQSQGRSGVKVLALLANLAKVMLDDPSRCYAEIGVYRGLTLGTVARSVPDRDVIGMDDFSYDEDGGNERRVRSHLQAIGPNKARIVKDDFERALKDFGRHLGGKRVALFLVDGPHDYRSQLLSLMLMRDWLTPDAVIVVDDCNYDHVRLATHDFLAIDPSFSLVMQAYTPSHPERGTEADLDAARRGWWDGIHVMARDVAAPGDPVLSVPIGDARRKCEQEHSYQSDRFYSEYYGLSNFAESSLRDSTLTYLKNALDLRKRLAANGELRALARDANTFSSQLPAFESI